MAADCGASCSWAARGMGIGLGTVAHTASACVVLLRQDPTRAGGATLGGHTASASVVLLRQGLKRGSRARMSVRVC